MTDRDRIRLLEQRAVQAEAKANALRRAQGGRIVRPASGGGGMSIPTYDDFPTIPDTYRIIRCKAQLWYAETGYTVWYPMIHFTDETGEPGT